MAENETRMIQETKRLQAQMEANAAMLQRLLDDQARSHCLCLL